jgi:hypothetical protein
MARSTPTGPIPAFWAGVLGLFVLATASGAPAATIVSITGEGSLQIDVSGDLYFDSGGLDLTDITLTAEETITIGSPPATAPDGFDQSLEIYDALDLVGLSIEDDAYFESFVWSGSASLSAANIYLTGSLEASGTIEMWAATIDIQGTAGGNPSGGPGNNPTGGEGGCSGADLSTGLDITAVSGPVGVVCVPGSGGLGSPGTIFPPPSVVPFPVVASAIPEPTSALLFLAGAGAIAACLRGRRWAHRPRPEAQLIRS